jgi:hypothetical protein
MAAASNQQKLQRMLEEDYKEGKRLYELYLQAIFYSNPDDAYDYKNELIEHINKYPIVFPMEDGASPFVPVPEEAPVPRVRGPRTANAPLGRWVNAPRSPVRPVALPAALQPTLHSMWDLAHGGKRKKKNKTRRRK